ncbi:MbeD family mobilization/exclusion protein, partial [Shigella flexneri]|uniref:MbeD family mobilization/exclusion protein n=1 Tax=Shigella flexneri TaxID=623 RepID=UPI003F53FF60
MTELESHLLNALEQLQQDYMQRLNEWESAFVELQKMFSLTQRDNAMLNERVLHLSQQLLHLSEQTELFFFLFSGPPRKYTLFPYRTPSRP